MTKTRTTDRNGNVHYEISDNGRVLGIVSKATSGYVAQLPTGGLSPRMSLKDATDWLVRYSR